MFFPLHGSSWFDVFSLTEYTRRPRPTPFDVLPSQDILPPPLRAEQPTLVESLRVLSIVRLRSCWVGARCSSPTSKTFTFTGLLGGFSVALFLRYV